MLPFQRKAQEFLKVAPQFKLGHLLTESEHPLTRNLSVLSQNNLLQAIEVLKEVDKEALKVLSQQSERIFELHQVVQKTFANGGRIFLSGCGATGRLSLALETFFIHLTGDKNKVISFMAGGDVALIKSIENFEDHPEFGERQLMELGFSEGDLLIATTEGGETPFVKGTALQAASVSKNSPYFLYCNPDHDLIQMIARSRQVIEDNRIKKINLSCGPMAISGSTRMQASTVLMSAIGFALLYPHQTLTELKKRIEDLLLYHKEKDFSFLAPLIKTESELYQQEKLVTYRTDNKLGLSVLTDTTERAPTFSLMPFENLNEKSTYFSFCYLVMKGTTDVRDAWENLLKRVPRTLEWKESPEQFKLTNQERLYGFDISENTKVRRENGKSGTTLFEILQTDDLSITWQLGDVCHLWKAIGEDYFMSQLLFKMALNIHSTLIMGRLKRYHGNRMSYVRPSNNKLIDRSIRYIDSSIKELKQSHPEIRADYSYEELAYACFKEIEFIKEDRPIVTTVVARLTGIDPLD